MCNTVILGKFLHFSKSQFLICKLRVIEDQPQGPCVCMCSVPFVVSVCDPVDHNPPGSLVCGILQARILECFGEGLNDMENIHYRAEYLLHSTC